MQAGIETCCLLVEQLCEEEANGNIRLLTFLHMCWAAWFLKHGGDADMRELQPIAPSQSIQQSSESLQEVVTPINVGFDVRIFGAQNVVRKVLGLSSDTLACMLSVIKRGGFGSTPTVCFPLSALATQNQSLTITRTRKHTFVSCG